MFRRGLMLIYYDYEMNMYIYQDYNYFPSYKVTIETKICVVCVLVNDFNRLYSIET